MMNVATWFAPVYPACAGIDPDGDCRNRVDSRLPRMRGDRPNRQDRDSLPRMRGDRPKDIRPSGEGWEFTPHARGSTLTPPKTGSKREVYPACAGIDPCAGPMFHDIHGLPRMRGDRPISASRIVSFFSFTPHARGSTAHSSATVTVTSVYPACAGIDLHPLSPQRRSARLPRMRGDRPLHAVA